MPIEQRRIELGAILDGLVAEERSGEYHDYLKYHSQRFEFVMGKCREFVPDASADVLDIGHSELTKRLKAYYRRVSVLGLEEAQITKFGEVGHRSGLSEEDAAMERIIYDLNASGRAEPIPTDHRFSLIVFAEVIEHLTVAPEMILAALKQVLSPDGVLICQTPNSAALHKRILMVIGKNPFERIRANYSDPGHYREYTQKELQEIARKAGYEVVHHEYRDYFDSGSGLKGMATRIAKALSKISPPLARGQTIVLRHATPPAAA
jgi:2-polyprenyl-3-methyl-5-hydroxy-6-metoxy-1,4-benzoquinol methylase